MTLDAAFDGLAAGSVVAVERDGDEFVVWRGASGALGSALTRKLQLRAPVDRHDSWL